MATADLQCLGHFLPSPFLLSFALVDQHRLRSILPPMSSCGMAERMAPDSELRFAFCWRVGRRVHSFRIQRGRRSRGVPAEGGRPRTSSPQRTRRRRRRRRTVCPSLLLLRTLPYIFRSTLPISRPVRPSFCQSRRGDCAPTPIPYIRVVPAQAASRRIQEEVSAVTHTYPKVKDRSRSLSKSTRRMRSVKVHVGNKFRILRDRKKAVASLCS